MSIVLVTGANGFVGQALCTEIFRQGWHVKAALRTPHQLPSRINSGIKPLTIGQINEKTDWAAALVDVDVVIHLAARVHVMKDTDVDPLAAFLKVNLYGTSNLAQQAVLAGVKRFVYVSSIKVNGEETHGQNSYTEQDRPAPQDPYGISKWEAEQTLQLIAQDTGLEVVIIRPPLVYGPSVKGNFLSLLNVVNKGIPLPLAGVRNARSLVYLGNLVNALMTCAVHPKAAGQTYLVRDDEDASTTLLVKKIAYALGRKDRLFYIPPSLLRMAATVLGRSAQVDKLFGSLRVNDAKLRSQLDWTPPYTLEQGLCATAAWYHQCKH